MSAVKKRKINSAVDSPPLSALAARRAKAQAAVVNTGTSEEAVSSRPSDSVTPLSQNGKQKQVLAETPRVQDLENSTADSGAQESVLKLEDEVPASSRESRAASPELPIQRPSIIFSTLKPSKNSIKELADGTLVLKLEPGERLVILGQFELSVKKGQVTLLGSTLQASKSSYRVYASSSHSLPVIRCAATDVDHAEIRLRQCETGLELLRTLSALFGSLWNDHHGPLGWEHSDLIKKNSKSSFKILFTTQDGPPKGFLQPLISPPEWNEAISRISENVSKKTPSIMLCGPKSSGKSTFAKILANRLLSIAQDAKGAKHPTGVAILDLDPGQPEYSPPGQLSLIHIREPNFGPPFSHPIPSDKNQIIRSHSIGAVSPSLDPSLYMACALDLFAHYRNFLSKTPNCPLVINTPGWILGTGLEILVDLIAKFQPTQVLYMSLDGPSEVVESLREASRSIPLFTLPSQGSEYATRTAAHLRTMQNMSYFHLDATSKKGLAWKDTPLTSIPPWQVGYSGGEAGILGVMCYGEQPPADLLADTINGSLVSVVVIHDMAAIPGWSEDQQDHDSSDETNEHDTHMQDNEIHVLDEETFHPAHLEKPLIVRTPNEDLPYFNPANFISLDPRHSHTIGLALVRGIDVERRCLQLLTPISSDVVREAIEAGKSIVLVSGKLDTPGWAYTEELVQSDLREKDARRKGGEVMDVDADENGDGDEDEVEARPSLRNTFRDAPWIERLHGSQGRGVGSRVWRVRRDLGKTGDGD